LRGDGYLARPRADIVHHRDELLGREIAELDRETREAGNDVWRIRRHFDVPDRTDLATGQACDGVADRHREMRGRQHRVLPLGNRRRAGMVREAGHDGVVLVDRDDPLDDADRDADALESTALLDVQLEVTVVRALRPARLENPIRVAADALDRLAATHAVPDLVHV